MYIDEELLGVYPSLHTVFYFENIEHNQDERKPHYHIAIPTKNNSYLLLVMFTSQLEKRKAHRQTNPDALSSLIFTNEREFDFLTKESVIDCNSPIYKTREELMASIDNLQPKEAHIPIKFRDKIIEAIKTSPIVRRNIKKALE